MCGICGIVENFHIRDDATSIVQNMMQKISHRGPDGKGIEKGENYTFGHQRLAIIDIDNGQQPMQTEDKKITLVYNGEIYNYIDLRQELSRKGVRFKTFSDTEVLLKLYEIEGEQCIKKLNGMFAFAIFDERENSFFAARDHFGIKPFYYTFLKNRGIVFASEIKSILAHPEVKAEVDSHAKQEYLTFQFCLKNKTLFKNIFKLEPGCSMKWSLGGESQPKYSRYWEQNYDIDTYHTEEYFLDKMLILLEDSIRQQMRSDVPVGAYLSGGIDSSTVSVLAAAQYREGFQCFTGKFGEGTAYDESEYAKILAQEANCILHEVVPTENDFVDFLPKLIYHMDEPIAGPGVFPQYMVARMAAEKVKVLLGGQGGDEIFGGYARYLVAYLEQCIKGAIFETNEEGKHVVSLNSIVPSLPLLKEYVPMLKGFWADGLFEEMDQRYFNLINRNRELDGLLTPEAREIYDMKSVFQEFCSVFNQPNTKSYINKMLNFDQKTLLAALLHIEDRMSMAVGIESRVPLLDYRIVELANSMPPTLKFRSGQPKWVLRKVMENLLPKPILSRKDKMGFPVPIKEWTSKGIVRDFIYDTLFSKAAKERGIYEVDALRRLLDHEQKFGRQIWGALSLEIWHQTFIDGKE